MLRHGEIVEPTERFKTYAMRLNVSDELIRRVPRARLEAEAKAAMEARARQEARAIDPRAPITIAVELHPVEREHPHAECWRLVARIEFMRYATLPE